jgi:hypothetical protein
MKVIYYNWIDDSAGGLFVPKGNIHPVVSASARTWFIGYIYRNLQFIYHVHVFFIQIKITKSQLVHTTRFWITFIRNNYNRKIEKTNVLLPWGRIVHQQNHRSSYSNKNVDIIQFICHIIIILFSHSWMRCQTLCAGRKHTVLYKTMEILALTYRHKCLNNKILKRIHVSVIFTYI